MSRTATLDADSAAALVGATDSIGMGLAISQPATFLHALGRRTDWVDLRIHGGFLAVLTDLFTHPNVHFLSVFFGPLERILRDAGANVGFAAADDRRFTPMLQEAPPPRHQVDTIVTEHGVADLQGKTVHQRGQALAAIAHPEFRDELLEAAARASGGRSPLHG